MDFDHKFPGNTYLRTLKNPHGKIRAPKKVK